LQRDNSFGEADALGGGDVHWPGCACAEQNDARNDDPHERQDECENTDEWHEEADAKNERSPPQPSLDSLATKKPTCGTEHHRPGCRQQRVDWRRLLLAGAAIMSATLGVAITTQLALADSTGPEIAPEVMQALNDVASNHGHHACS
jgi:hypothetical protein